MLCTPHRRPHEPERRRAPYAVGVPLLLALAQNGCLCPPCTEVPGGGNVGTAAAGESGGAAKTAASGESHMIWDGDTVGGKAQGWADCDDKPNCKTKLAAAGGEGVDGGMAVHFHGDGKKWLGMGWNWFGWWPEDAGTDITPYDTLEFSIRIEVPDPKQAPEPAGMTVALGCSAGKKTSASPSLDKYLKNPGDGKWHEVAIPLAEFYKGKEGKEFDPRSAWEMKVGTWAANHRTFDIYLDNIRVSKK